MAFFGSATSLFRAKKEIAFKKNCQKNARISAINGYGFQFFSSIESKKFQPCDYQCKKLRPSHYFFFQTGYPSSTIFGHAHVWLTYEKRPLRLKIKPLQQRKPVDVSRLFFLQITSSHNPCRINHLCYSFFYHEVKFLVLVMLWVDIKKAQQNLTRSSRPWPSPSKEMFSMCRILVA